MADIPLNHFVRKAYPLTTSLSALYTAPYNRAAVILAAYATNNTVSDVTVTVGISGAGGKVGGQQTVQTKPYYNYAKDIMIAGNDTTNLIPSKMVLEEFDVLIASCSVPDAITINMSLLETNNQVV
jgi:tripartite-type tricarboxylate transporter receptor subunit TctC